MSAFFSFYNQHLQIANRMLIIAPLYEEDQTPVLIFRLESRRVEEFRGGGKGRGRGFQVEVMRMLGTYGVSIKLYRNTTKIIQHYHLPS